MAVSKEAIAEARFILQESTHDKAELSRLCGQVALNDSSEAPQPETLEAWVFINRTKPERYSFG